METDASIPDDSVSVETQTENETMKSVDGADHIAKPEESSGEKSDVAKANGNGADDEFASGGESNSNKDQYEAEP